MRLRSKLLIAFILVMTLVVAPVATLLVVGSFDAPPVDDADLRPQRVEVPDDQNGFPLLREAYAAMFWPAHGENLDGTIPEDTGEEVLSDAERLGNYMVSGEKWDDALADEVLRRNREALDLVDRALARPQFQLPYIDSVDAELPYIYECLQLSQLLAVKSRAQAHRGEAAEAYATAMKIVRFGDRLERANNCLVTYLVGLTVRGLGLELFRDYAATCPLPSEDLRAYAKCLADSSSRGEELAHTLRLEYVLWTNLLDQSLAGTLKVGAVVYRGSPWAFEASSYRFHPNRTKRFYAEAYRAYVAATSRPYWKAKAEIDALWNQYKTRKATFHNHWWSPYLANDIGEGIYCTSMPPIPGIFLDKAKTEIALTVTRLLLLLRAYKDEHGRLPETLDALVPAYLDAVPPDPFDGRPIRYDVQKRILYSVGKDGVDTGGLAREEQERWWKEEEPDWAEDEPLPPPERMPDPSYLIEF